MGGMDVRGGRVSVLAHRTWACGQVHWHLGMDAPYLSGEHGEVCWCVGARSRARVRWYVGCGRVGCVRRGCMGLLAHRGMGALVRWCGDVGAVGGRSARCKGCWRDKLGRASFVGLFM